MNVLFVVVCCGVVVPSLVLYDDLAYAVLFVCLFGWLVVCVRACGEWPVRCFVVGWDCNVKRRFVLQGVARKWFLRRPVKTRRQSENAAWRK